MNIRNFIFKPFILLSVLSVTFLACNDDDNNDSLDGNVTMEITDAPIDDSHVEGVFVTVADVKVNGESWDGFAGKSTIELSAYQQGQTKSLGSGTLETGTYSDVTLVLDNEEDANGNSPGCYVLRKDGQKEALATSSKTEVQANGSFNSETNETKNLVLDFDLRKAITHEGGSTDQYQFVTQSELNSTTRLVTKSETGTVTGEVNDNITTSDKIVVYAYKSGTYDKDQEMQGQGASSIQFKNAVSSTAVADDGSYTFAFLESGDYELKFISYKDKNNDGTLEINGTLLLDVVGGADLNTVSITSGATLTLDVRVTGLLPL